MNSFLKFIVSFFGLGFLPAPGTWGSLGTLALVYAVSGWGLSFKILAFVLFNLVAFWVVGLYLAKTGSKDPKEVVLDEVSGQWLALLPFAWRPDVFILGFLLFRFFDILKPSYIKHIDHKWSGTSGVMCDDILAGFCAQILLWGYLWIT